MTRRAFCSVCLSVPYVGGQQVASVNKAKGPRTRPRGSHQDECVLIVFLELTDRPDD